MLENTPVTLMPGDTPMSPVATAVKVPSKVMAVPATREKSAHAPKRVVVSVKVTAFELPRATVADRMAKMVTAESSIIGVIACSCGVISEAKSCGRLLEQELFSGENRTGYYSYLLQIGRHTNIRR